jgi:hypothetical protein
MALPRGYLDATAPASTVDVWWRYKSEAVQACRFAGNFPVGQLGSIPFNPDREENVIFHLVSKSADGVPSVIDLEDAVQVELVIARETSAAVVTQVDAATAEVITIAVDNVTRFARVRRIRISPNADMSDASVTEKDFGSEPMPRLVDVARTAALVADFSWSANDPATHGFTKTGSGTTATSGSPAGWKITTSASDASTYYTKTAWPAGAFAAGFTLELQPPAVNASDGSALPNDSIMVRVEDGSKKYELRFDSTNVYLNGGAARAHGGLAVRLVVAVGGAVADLWVGDTKVENDTAGGSTATSGLSFGDLAGGDDSEVVWKSLAYALTPQDVTLAQTIYVRVAHSGGGTYGPESAVASFTFANEVTGSGGSSGTGELVPRDQYTYEPI